MAERFDKAAYDIAIDQWIEKANGNVRAFAVNVINRLNVEVIIRSPGPGNSIQVHPAPRTPTGFLRGSWFAQLDAPPNGIGQVDPNGGASIARVSVVAAALEIGQTYYVVNTAKYAPRLEYGFVGTDTRGRHYNQAGRYWVRSVVGDAPSIAEQVANDIASGTKYRPTGGISGGRFTAGPAVVGG